MEKVNIDKCPICGSTDISRALTCVDHSVSGEMFHLCRCGQCSFLFTQGFPDKTSMSRYLRMPDYSSLTDSHHGLVNKLFYRVRRHMLKEKARVVERATHRDSGRLLDIGTGVGDFAGYMAHRGWRVEAVEKDADARGLAQERYALEVKPRSALNRYEAHSFDAITLWQVMQDMPSINEMWDRLHALLTPGGALIVAVPNCSSFDARKYGAYWAAYDVPRHLWHFTPDSIQRIAQRHGFVMREHRPMPFDAFYVSILTERYMRHNLPFVRGMLTGVLSWMAALSRKERSSSMIYVFRIKNG